MVEIYYQCQSDNGSITDSHALRQWSNRYIQSLEGLKDMRAPTRLQTLFTAAGFVDVELKVIPLPTCGWSNGRLCFSIPANLDDHGPITATKVLVSPESLLMTLDRT